MCKTIYLLSLLIIFSTQSSFAAYEHVLPKDAPDSFYWIFSRASACLQADNLHHVNANGECIAIQTYYAKNQLPEKNPHLLIYIHGDVIPGGGPSDYLKFQATQLVSKNTVAVHAAQNALEQCP